MTSAGRVAARDQLPRTDTRCTEPARAETEAGTTEGIRRSSSYWLSELLGRGRHKMQAQPSLCFCGVPENWNLSGLGLASACNSGPAPCRSTWSLSSIDGKAHTQQVGANPAGPEHCEHSPHTPVIFVCSALPRHSTTEQGNLNKRPPPLLVSGRKLDTEETCKQKPNKQRELLQK